MLCIDEPLTHGYTIYSKTGCPNCDKSCDLLNTNMTPFKYVLCDTYLAEDRLAFLAKMKIFAEGEVKMFPMVFFDGEYIGGFKSLSNVF